MRQVVLADQRRVANTNANAGSQRIGFPFRRKASTTASDKSSPSRRSRRHFRRCKTHSSNDSSAATHTTAAGSFFSNNKNSSNSSNTSVTPPWEMERTSNEEPPASLSTLSVDLQLQIFDFCDVKSIRSMMQVNHHYRDLLAASDEAKNLWKEQCHRQWTWLEASPSLDIVDDLHIPTAAVHTSKAPNLSLLLSCAADKSTRNDESIFSPGRWNSILRRFLPDGGDATSQLATVQTQDGSTAVQFTGPVGLGDRCIRADQPLPRPVLLLRSAKWARLHALWHRVSKPLALLQRHPHHHAHASVQTLWRPFVAPLVQHEQPLTATATTTGDSNTTATAASTATSTSTTDTTATNVRLVVNLTPRLISYFEVTVLMAPEDDDDDDNVSSISNAAAAAAATTNSATHHAESVGIGLATEEFDLHHCMPGWDAHSYGYHGDDGGLYHGRGDRLSVFGPEYGVGDVVGCGLDYHKRAIFYTRNGQFLGYAFENLPLNQLQKDFYPVVGIDTHCPVQFNFGIERPFQFDLNGMMKQQRAVVLQTLMPKKKKR